MRPKRDWPRGAFKPHFYGLGVGTHGLGLGLDL